MSKDRIDEILHRLELLKMYIGLLRGYKGISAKGLEDNFEKRGAVERYLQLSIEIVLDVADLIIAEYRLPVAKNYREAIIIIGKAGVLNKKFAESFSRVAGFRNILVHDYVEVDYQLVSRFLRNNLKDFEMFVRQVSCFLSV